MRKITLTKEVYKLYQELERLEDKLYFSAFYPLERAFESHHFLPGFYVEDKYYEIHENDNNELIVLQFGHNAMLDDLGYELNTDDIQYLVSVLKEIQL